MNAHFVNIKVDREERPDVDAVYMQAVQALTQHGGWPLTAFLTPEGEPFYGGTYYPPEPRHGMPGFRQVLKPCPMCGATGATKQPAAAQLTRPAAGALAPGEGEPQPELLAERGRGDREPLRGAPRRLGRRAKVSGAADDRVLAPALARGDTLEQAEATLDHMAAAGSTTSWAAAFIATPMTRWLVPHFEKMLYDNAQLAATYLHAWLVTGDDRYRDVSEATVSYLLRELALPEGGFASAQDADTNGVEGLTFTWTLEEGAPAELLKPFEHGRSILRGELDPELAPALRAARAEAEAAPRRQGDRILERACARRSCRSRVAARAAGVGRCGAAARRVPARAALGSPGSAAPQLPRRTHERHRLSGRLRERRARPARAPRRDRRAPLAR